MQQIVVQSEQALNFLIEVFGKFFSLAKLSAVGRSKCTPLLETNAQVLESGKAGQVSALAPVTSPQLEIERMSESILHQR